jgi:alkylation response protein AidB-like acyl-CoA dehydrogenase
MCDGFLTLAYTDVPAAGGKSASKALSCFLVPRWLSDGTRNTGFRVVRLKEKLGDKSNASSEVEYDNAVGYLLVSLRIEARNFRLMPLNVTSLAGPHWTRGSYHS